MAMLLRCPLCQAQFPVEDAAAGTNLRCDCGATVRVPQTAPIMAQMVDPSPSGAGAPPPLQQPTFDSNPYASPQSADGVFAALPADMLWRHGATLVMHKSAALPDVCVKSNQPADGRRLKRKLSWHPQLITLTILISPLIYIILAVILTKRATIHIGLSQPYFKRRRIAIATGWLVALFSLGLFVMMLAAIDQFQAAPLFILAGVLGIVAGLVIGNLGGRMVRTTRITDSHVYLKGCHPDFLARFPTWPHGG